ncbi:hypothetical protein GQ53DRAFT_747279 [Thozetella sp. PMI_491]|nr:hypothetical protein GQ53DRAFT_747279 [Thozetella sp. PMI_491]
MATSWRMSFLKNRYGCRRHGTCGFGMVLVCDCALVGTYPIGAIFLRTPRNAVLRREDVGI